jgi:hypothetical protein
MMVVMLAVFRGWSTGERGAGTDWRPLFNSACGLSTETVDNYVDNLRTTLRGISVSQGFQDLHKK